MSTNNSVLKILDGYFRVDEKISKRVSSFDLSSFDLINLKTELSNGETLHLSKIMQIGQYKGLSPVVIDPGENDDMSGQSLQATSSSSV